MNQTVNITVKASGIGDLCILIANIHAISKSIGKPVVVLAQKSTHANSILKNDPFVKEVIELDKKGFFNITKKIKPYKFDQSYIFSDSMRFYLISKLSGIKEYLVKVISIGIVNIQDRFGARPKFFPWARLIVINCLICFSLL